MYYNSVRGQHGERYADLTQEPLFAFGEGLSYTRIEYSDLQIHRETLTLDGIVSATVTLTNTGHRPALETVQVYISDTITSVTWAHRELKAFTQVTVPPGAQVDVVLHVPVADCSIVDAKGMRTVEPGDFDILVGPSSRDRDLLRGSFTVVPPGEATADAVSQTLRSEDAGGTHAGQDSQEIA